MADNSDECLGLFLLPDDTLVRVTEDFQLVLYELESWLGYLLGKLAQMLLPTGRLCKQRFLMVL